MILGSENGEVVELYSQSAVIDIPLQLRKNISFILVTHGTGKVRELNHSYRSFRVSDCPGIGLIVAIKRPNYLFALFILKYIHAFGQLVILVSIATRVLSVLRGYRGVCGISSAGVIGTKVVGDEKNQHQYRDC